MLKQQRVAAALFALSIACPAGAQEIMPRAFEATAVIEHIDTISGVVILNGKRYVMADTTRVYGVEGGRQQLKPGQTISFQLDTTTSAAVITDIMVIPKTGN